MNIGIFTNLVRDSFYSTINDYYQIPTFIFSFKGSDALWLLENGYVCWEALWASSQVMLGWWWRGLRGKSSACTCPWADGQLCVTVLREPAGTHEEQRGVSGSHRSDSSIWLPVESYGSNWPYLSICLIHMNCIRAIPLFSPCPADVFFRPWKYSSTNIK